MTKHSIEFQSSKFIKDMHHRGWSVTFRMSPDLFDAYQETYTA